MSLEQKTVTIAGTEITIQQLGAQLALKHSIILGKLFGGMAHGIDSKGKKEVLDWNIDVGKMVDGVISNLDPEESPAWIMLLLKQSMIKPEFTDDWFNVTFSGGLENLLELLKVILEHNYGGLLAYTRKKIEAVTTSDSSSEVKENPRKQ